MTTADNCVRSTCLSPGKDRVTQASRRELMGVVYGNVGDSVCIVIIIAIVVGFNGIIDSVV